ncbi:MAG: aconitase X catalytic domain-containing protein [Aigarchaeota archaeon]|nr:aconitase X catalytic domain-containing protein [Aigarchaeota archaeon]MCX8193172.1 aconitase X catalytic domain-containing protein [Nitrososphaeria archaeon]MDW7986313.1 aconitase X catalytic domain-containing protein [Nitrososphaerota archaeon]
MYLTREEEKMLAGEMGHAVQVAMEILVALGEIYGAEKMVPITSAQVSGVSYKNLGEAGLEWLEDLSKDGRVRVQTTLNPAGIDLEKWREIGVSENFVEMQKRVIDAYLAMGIKPTLTCTPYLAENMPRFAEHIAWSESSAVVYANSVIGARTNREGGPSALAAALTGRTPFYGLHLMENRVYSIKVISPNLEDEYDFALLGYVVGKQSKGRIPLFTGIRSANQSELKALGAALGSISGTPMFHVEGITPEYTLTPEDRVEEIEVSDRDLENASEELNDDVEPDLIFIGCPHASLEELIMLIERLENRVVKKKMWVCTSRAVGALAKKLGVYQKLERLGVTILSDTCPIVAPINELNIRSIATNSVKGVWYSRNLNNLSIKLAKLSELVEEAVRD